MYYNQSLIEKTKLDIVTHTDDMISLDDCATHIVDTIFNEIDDILIKYEGNDLSVIMSKIDELRK